jgi:hypothetical protein
MAAPDDLAQTDRELFELSRFVWGAPDQLEVAGTFVGLREPPEDAPVLVVHGSDGTHRLPAVTENRPEEGQRWVAAFAWQEAPVAFETAELEFGPDCVVELPEPGAKRMLFRQQVLEVRRSHAERPAPETPASLASPSTGAERMRLEADLLAAQEEAREARAALERTEDELARARQDLAAERERQTADAERFREGLARVRASAEQALAAEHAAVEGLRAELEQTGGLRTRIADAGAAAEEARTEAERLMERLTTIHDVLGGGR